MSTAHTAASETATGGPAAESLAAGIAALGLDVPAQTQSRLLAWLDLLSRWNRTYHLTAIRAQDAMITHHLLDALAILPVLETTVVAGRRTLLLGDVGSGAGVPAIPLALARPEWSVLSVESVAKKAAFQRQAKIELKISNLDVREARVETVDQSCDMVLSRAFASLADFVRLAGHLAAPGGCLCAMKAHLSDEESAALPTPWHIAARLPCVVPGLPARRELVVLKRD